MKKAKCPVCNKMGWIEGESRNMIKRCWRIRVGDGYRWLHKECFVNLKTPRWIKKLGINI